MVDESLNRWLHSRLSLVERVNLQRRDEEAETYLTRSDDPETHNYPQGRFGRCAACMCHLTQEDVGDPYRRCKSCRGNRRLQRRGS